jgi:DNA-binding NarL/FixJ family response regulator
MRDIKIAVVDDHKLMRKGLVQLLQGAGYRIVAEGDHGKDLIDKLAGRKVDIVLMDVSMPVMDGIETTAWLRKNQPEAKVIALTMNNDDPTMIRMFKAGAKGYLMKDTDPEELLRALERVQSTGFYYTDLIAGPLIQALNPLAEKEVKLTNALSEREIVFLRHACSEMSYRQIADVMNVSSRTVDGYRDELFNKLGVKSRIGLVVYAIKHGHYTI